MSSELREPSPAAEATAFSGIMRTASDSRQRPLEVAPVPIGIAPVVKDWQSGFIRIASA